MPLLLVAPGVLLVGLFLLAWTQTHHAVVKSHAESGGYWAAIKAQLSLGGNSFVRLFVALANFAVSRFAHTYIVHVTRFFTGLNLLVRADARNQTRIIEETADAAERMRGVVVPREIHKAVTPVRLTAREAHREAERARAKAHSVGDSLDRYKARTTPQIKALRHAADVTLPRDIAKVRRGEDALSRDLGKLRERTKALEDGAVDVWHWLGAHRFSAAAAAFAGAVAFALGRLGLSGLNCNSLKGLLKRGGCSTWSSLEDLLGLVATVLAITDLEELVKEGQAIEHLATEGIAELVGLDDWLKNL